MTIVNKRKGSFVWWIVINYKVSLVKNWTLTKESFGFDNLGFLLYDIIRLNSYTSLSYSTLFGPFRHNCRHL